MKKPIPFKALEELNAREEKLERLLFIIGAETVEEATEIVKNTQTAIRELHDEIGEFIDFLYTCEHERHNKVELKEVQQYSEKLNDKSLGALKFLPDWQRPYHLHLKENVITAAGEALEMFLKKYAAE